MQIRRFLRRELRVTCLLGFMISIFPYYSFCQEQEKTIPDGTEGERLDIIDSTSASVGKTKKSWNTFNLGFTTFKIGGAFLYEYAGFSQDETAKEQMDSARVDLKSAFDVRDFRVLLSG